VTYNLSLEGGALRLRIGRPEPVNLSIKKKDLFSVRAGEIAFLRSSSGQITGFRLDSGRVRGLLFEKRVH
jgi:hypothetical protein